MKVNDLFIAGKSITGQGAYIFKGDNNECLMCWWIKNRYVGIVEKYLKKDYNEHEAQIEAFKELARKFDIMIEEVADDGM